MSGSGKSTLLYLLGLLWDGGLEGEIDYHRGGEAISYSEQVSDQGPSGGATCGGPTSGSCSSRATCVPALQRALQNKPPCRLALQGVDRPDEVADPAQPGQGGRRAGRLPLRSVMEQPRGSSVSGGQRQRFAVVRAVVHDPYVVFADEPFSSLDEENTELTLRPPVGAWAPGRVAAGQADTCPGRAPLILVCPLGMRPRARPSGHAPARDSLPVFVTRTGHVLENRAFEKRRFRNGPIDLRLRGPARRRYPAAAGGNHDGLVAAAGGQVSR